MKLYINNLLERLRQFSDSLDKMELFIDIPWIVIDNDSKQQKFIFKRNGQLIMSLNGQVSIGKWEYLSEAKSLLIDRIKDKLLLNQKFIDSAVMVLNRDGIKDDNLMLINENILPGLDATEYLKKLYYQKNGIVVRELKAGNYLEISNYSGLIRGNSVTIEGDPVQDGIFELAQSRKKYVIKDSTIVRTLKDVYYQTNRGIITIEQDEFLNPSIGDFVFQFNLPALDGRYRLGFLRYIKVQNGKIISC